jgi:hypothetical protein
MTNLCTVCEQEIKHGESHIGPPFEDEVRHMKCPKDEPGKFSMSRAELKEYLTGKPA